MFNINMGRFFPSFSNLITWTPGVDAATVALIAKEFFADLFRHPTNHVGALLFFGVLILGTLLGGVYLIKLTYDRYVAERGY